MIPYELVIPSASRPHLLDEVLRTLFLHLDQRPTRVLIHDDAVFSGKQMEVREVIAERVPPEIPTIVLVDEPPICHGPSLKRLLDLVSTDYVLYSQDDHRVVRDLPVAFALDLLNRHGLNQIRFNKRTTADKKGREGEEFYKVEKKFLLVESEREHEAWYGKSGIRFSRDQTLCIADHWYFQTGVWRVGSIKPVLDWWAAHPEIGAFSEHMEVKINQVFNGEWAKHHGDFGSEVPTLKAEDGAWNDPEVRARVHKTFIWGKVGEPQFVDHTGFDPKDWALVRGNRDQPGKEKA
jgi:hypothetical protein